MDLTQTLPVRTENASRQTLQSDRSSILQTVYQVDLYFSLFSFLACRKQLKFDGLPLTYALRQKSDQSYTFMA